MINVIELADGSGVAIEDDFEMKFRHARTAHWIARKAAEKGYFLCEFTIGDGMMFFADSKKLSDGSFVAFLERGRFVRCTSIHEVYDHAYMRHVAAEENGQDYVEEGGPHTVFAWGPTRREAVEALHDAIVAENWEAKPSFHRLACRVWARLARKGFSGDEIGRLGSITPYGDDGLPREACLLDKCGH